MLLLAELINICSGFQEEMRVEVYLNGLGHGLSH